MTDRETHLEDKSPKEKPTNTDGFRAAVHGETTPIDLREAPTTHTTTSDKKAPEFQRAATQKPKDGESLLNIFLLNLLQNQNEGTEHSMQAFQVFAAILGFATGQDARKWLSQAANERSPGQTKQDLLEQSSGIDYGALSDLNNKRPDLFVTREATYPAGTEGLLAMIRDAEHSVGSPECYNIAYGNRSANFTDMTINQVMQWQRENNPEGLGTAACGGYQIILPTMEMLVDRMGLSGNEKFDIAMQDRMAVELATIRGLGRLQGQDLLTNLSKEWASVPTDSSGKSYYDGDGINSAQIAYHDAMRVIDNLNTLNNGLDPTSPTMIA